MGSDGLIAALRGVLGELRERFGVAELGVFGSAARGDDGPDSDLDILVAFMPDARYTMMTLSDVRERLEAATGRRVDLVTRHPGLRRAFLDAVGRDLIRVA